MTKWSALVLLISGVLILIPNLTDTFGTDWIGVFCFGCTAFMAYQLFCFLNQRAASDFMHMLSQGRLVVYVSYCLAILTWVSLVMLVLIGGHYLHRDSDMIVMFGNMCFTTSEHGSILEMYVMVYCYCMAICVLTLGGMTLAMSITGNVMTNILAAITILFVPRILLSGYVECFYELCPYVSNHGFLGKLTDSSYNVLFGMDDFFSPGNMMISYYAADLDRTIKIAIAYSMILGLIYMGIGGSAFCRRKSEAAESSTMNRFMQVAFRVAIGLTCCIIPIRNLAQDFTGRSSESVMRDSSLLWYAFAAFLWVLVEFLTTRKREKVVKSLVQLPILAVFNVIVIGSLVLLANVSEGKIPEADNVTAVEILRDTKGTMDIHDAVSSSYGAYVDGMISNSVYEILEKEGGLILTSAQAKELLVTMLSEDIELCHSKPEDYSREAMGQNVCEVRFYEGDESFVRLLHMDEEQSHQIMEFVVDNAKKIYEYDFPMIPLEKLEQENVEFSCSYFDGWLSVDSYEELYNLLYKEWKELHPPLEVFLGNWYAREGVVDYLNVSSGGLLLQIPITLDTVESLEYLLNRMKNIAVYFDYQWFAEEVEQEDKDYCVELVLCTKEDKVLLQQKYEQLGTHGMKAKDILQLKDMLLQHKEDDTIKVHENLLYIHYYDGWDNEIRWLNITDEEVELVQQIMDNPTEYGVWSEW